MFMRDVKNVYKEQPRKKIAGKILSLVALVGMTAVMVTSCVGGIEKTIEIEEKQNAPLREERERIMRGDKLVDAFHAAGSPVPHQMAAACRTTKDPHLMAAVAIVESNGTPNAVGRSGERGAWQVIPKVWGSVPKSVVGQARQSERILDELVAASPRGSLRCALARYNGGDNPPAQSWRYADKVLRVRKSLG